jgi:multiple sugar transport system permease protein
MQNKDKVWMVYVFPALFVVLIVGVGPLLYSLVISTFQFNLAKVQIPFRFVGLKNYATLFTSPNFWNSLKLTVIFVITSVSIELVLGTVLALVLVDLQAGRNIFRSLFLISMMITPLGVGLMGRFIFDDVSGIVPWVFRQLGLPQVIWYGDPHVALITMIILDVWEWSSFVFLLVLAGLMGIPVEYYEAAHVEGAGLLTRLFRITLPTLRPVYLLAALIRVVDAFKEFDKVYIMTKGGPTFSTDLISIRNYTIAFKEYNIGLGSALSILFLILMIFIGTFLVRTLTRKS